MYTIEQYNNDITLLVRSIVIKHHNIGLVMERGVTPPGTPLPADIKTWKYYLNLAGIPHPTNNPVTVTILETGLNEPLTTAVLDKYPGTRAELDRRVDSYNALLDNYPDDHVYINGCIAPTALDVSTAAVDGTVLSISKHYVEQQEYSLQRELSAECSGYFSRWYVTDYNITDELYMSSVLAVLYGALPGIVNSIRMRSVGTSEAHSFHLEHFFRSHLDCWEQVKNLSTSTIWWLYRNLVWLMNNTGSNLAMSSLIDNVLTPNRIGVGAYELGHTEYQVNSYAPGVSRYTNNGAVFNAVKLNNAYTPPSPVLTPGGVVRSELRATPTTLYPDAMVLDNVTRVFTDKLNTTAQLKQNTKTLDLGKVELFSKYSNNYLLTVLDNWLHTAYSGDYIVSHTYADPSAGGTYHLDAKSGVLLFYYLLYTKLGIADPTLGIVDIKDILAPSITKSELMVNKLGSTGLDYAASIISGELPVSPGIMRSTTAFAAHIDNITTYYTRVWGLDSNVDNNFLSGDIKAMVAQVMTGSTVTVSSTNTPLKTVLAGMGVNINVTAGYNVDTALTTLFNLFTGKQLSETVVLKSIYDGYKLLLDKLTSYATQVIPADVVGSGLTVPYSTTAPTKSDVGYITVTAANIVKAIEDPISPVAGAGNNSQIKPDVVARATMRPATAALSTRIRMSGRGTVRYSGAGVTRTTAYAEILRGVGYNKYYPGMASTGDQQILNAVNKVSSTSNTGTVPTSLALGGIATGKTTTPQNAGITSPATVVELPAAGIVHFTPTATGGQGSNISNNQVSGVTNAGVNGPQPVQNTPGATLSGHVPPQPSASVSAPVANVQMPSPGIQHFAPTGQPVSANNTTGVSVTANTPNSATTTTASAPATPTTAATGSGTTTKPTKPTTTGTIK